MSFKSFLFYIVFVMELKIGRSFRYDTIEKITAFGGTVTLPCGGYTRQFGNGYVVWRRTRQPLAQLEKEWSSDKCVSVEGGNCKIGGSLHLVISDGTLIISSYSVHYDGFYYCRYGAEGVWHQGAVFNVSGFECLEKSSKPAQCVNPCVCDVGELCNDPVECPGYCTDTRHCAAGSDCDNETGSCTGECLPGFRGGFGTTCIRNVRNDLQFLVPKTFSLILLCTVIIVLRRNCVHNNKKKGNSVYKLVAKGTSFRQSTFTKTTESSFTQSTVEDENKTLNSTSAIFSESRIPRSSIQSRLLTKTLSAKTVRIVDTLHDSSPITDRMLPEKPKNTSTSGGSSTIIYNRLSEIGGIASVTVDVTTARSASGLNHQDGNVFNHLGGSNVVNDPKM